MKFVLAQLEDQSRKRERFSEQQIIGILKEHEAGISVADLCRKHEVSDASIYKWKAKFGGMEVSEATHLMALEDVNTKLKRMLADAMLDNVALKDFCGEKSGDACQAESCRASHELPWNERMKAIAHERRRFGYRRLHVPLKREGFLVNHKRLFRLYREERLAA